MVNPIQYKNNRNYKQFFEEYNIVDKSSKYEIYCKIIVLLEQKNCNTYIYRIRM